MDNGKVDTKTVAMAKWFASKTAVQVVDEALQLHGGTKEIEKLIIARRVLGRYLGIF